MRHISEFGGVLSLKGAASLLGKISGHSNIGQRQVLECVLQRGLQASVLIDGGQLLVWPMAILTGDEALSFKADEQDTKTYRGRSITVDGQFLAPNRADMQIKYADILDLPIGPASEYLYRLKYGTVPHGKRLVLPRQTLLKDPVSGDYFTSIDLLDAPDVFFEIVIRAQSVIDFERDWIELNEAIKKCTNP